MKIEPSADSEVVRELSPGRNLPIEEPAEQGNGWHCASLWLGGSPIYGYIQILKRYRL